MKSSDGSYKTKNFEIKRINNEKVLIKILKYFFVNNIKIKNNQN